MFFDNIIQNVATIVLGIVIAIYLYFRWSFSHWERKRMPCLEPTFPFGNMENPFSRKHSLGILMKRFYDQLKARGHKHGGFYNFSSPVYIPVDPEYVKNVMQNDFNDFVDRGAYYNEKDDPLSAHLFAIGGKKWRRLRTKLTPTFSSGKMKLMFATFVKASQQMLEATDVLIQNQEPLDIKDVVARFTTDIIGLCAFGLECNSFKHPDAEFRVHGRNIFAPHSKFKAIRHAFGNAKPKLAQYLGVTMLPANSSKFFLDVIKDTLRFRKEFEVVRNDMLQLLIDLKSKNASNEEEAALTVQEIAAQALVFFLAGFETSSTTMSYCLFELALNLEIQEKVRCEIEKVLGKHDGKLTYDSIGEMKYLEQVVEETLRKYPPLSFINRRCVLDYKVPGTEITIDKGTLVFIPCFGLHRDPELFPDPEKFDPERFSDINRGKIRPFSYLPFGAGPRVCIGLRFGMMQTKVGLVSLLRSYRFSLNSKTQLPLQIDPYAIILTSLEDILLDAEVIAE